MRFKKLGALLLVVVLFLVGCQGQSGRMGGGNTKILFAISNFDAFLSSLADGAQEYADANGIELVVESAERSIEKQVDMVAAAKSNGYTAVICVLVDSDTAQQVIDSANGLPVIFLNTPLDTGLLRSNEVVYVGSDEAVSGQYQGEFIAEYYKGKSSLDVILLQGALTHPGAIARTKSAKRALRQAGIDANYVFFDSAGWSRDKAAEMFKVFSELNKSFDAVICNNDEMALGVVRAMKDLGMDPSSIPIVGVDATADGRQAIIDGDMKFTVYQSATGQGKYACIAAEHLARGQSLESVDYVDEDNKAIWVPFEPVDKNNVMDYQ